MLRIKLLVLVALTCASLWACDKKGPLGPSPTTCEDPKATNLGGSLPCKFAPLPFNLESRAFAVNPGGGGIGINARALEFPAPGKLRVVSVYTPADANGLQVFAFYGNPEDLARIAGTCLGRTTNLCPEQLTLSRESDGTSPKTHYFDDYDGRRVIVFIRNRGQVDIRGTAEVWYDAPGVIQP
ncbi:MAG: hypothetical protein AAB638_02975 [Patescibacteria group bacterium]